MKNISLLIIFLISTILLSQPTFDDGISETGIIRGKIIDSKTGEAIVGAMVIIEGTTKGTTTDLDGNFVLKVPANRKLSLKIQYIGYVNKTLDGLLVETNDEKDFSIALEESKANQLDEVEIVTSVIKENNFALILQQKNNASVSDGISA
jgi:hypothetical protein